jgi:CheY-like chemotaxis protein
MDVRMPVMDGLQATRAIRALDRADAASVPIIAMTADAYADDVRKCIDAGMNAHVPKPIDPEVLTATLAKWCMRS